MRLPANAGFSLVEVMVAILILGVAIVGLSQGVVTALKCGKESERQTTASLFAAGEIEKMRTETDWKDEVTEGDCGGELPLYRWKKTIAAAGVDGLHQVEVVISEARSGQEIYALKTLLFQRPEDQSSKSNRRRETQRSTGGRS